VREITVWYYKAISGCGVWGWSGSGPTGGSGPSLLPGFSGWSARVLSVPSCSLHPLNAHLSYHYRLRKRHPPSPAAIVHVSHACLVPLCDVRSCRLPSIRFIVCRLSAALSLRSASNHIHARCQTCWLRRCISAVRRRCCGRLTCIRFVVPCCPSPRRGAASGSYFFFLAHYMRHPTCVLVRVHFWTLLACASHALWCCHDFHLHRPFLPVCALCSCTLRFTRRIGSILAYACLRTPVTACPTPLPFMRPVCLVLVSLVPVHVSSSSPSLACRARRSRLLSSA
jgi:hypothetical protein